MSTRRFLDRLFEYCADGVVEVRALPSARRTWAALKDWTSLGPFLTAEMNQSQNLYVGVATRRDTSSGTTENLSQLPALFVDWDMPLADVRVRLEDFPYQPSLLVGSGLGVHGYFLLREPIDLRDSAGVHQAASLLRRLSAYFGGDDRATDPARVLRIPGTYSFKYDAPRALSLIHDDGMLINSSELDDFLPREVVRKNRVVLESTITAGGRNDTLYSLIRSLRVKGLGRPAIEQAIATVNATQCDPPLPDDEVRKLLNHAWKQVDRSDFEPPQPVVVIHDAVPSTITEPVGVVVNLATVQPEAVEWLWPSWLPSRKAIVLAGDPGLGKSMISVDWAARVTIGGLWPTGDRAPQGRALFLCAEDGLADTVRPRLDAAGGDARQVEVLTGVRMASGDRLVNLATDLSILRDVIMQYRPRLIVIDPITAYLGNTDSYKDAEVRALLAPLLTVVDQAGAVLVWIAHLTKAAERKALYRPGASIAFVAAARVALIVGEHPEDPRLRVVAQAKNNLAAKASSVAYAVETGRVVWGGSVSFTAEDIVQPMNHDEQEVTFTAKGLIATLRQEHPDGVIEVRDAVSRAELLDIPERTLRHAARRAGLVPYSKGFGAKRRAFWFDTARTDLNTAKAAIAAMVPHAVDDCRDEDDHDGNDGNRGNDGNDDET